LIARWSSFRHRAPLLAAAFGIGATIEIATQVFLSHYEGVDANADAAPGVFASVCFYALPFIALSFKTRQHLIPWLFGAVVMAWLARLYVQEAVAYQRNPDGSGVGSAAMLFGMAPLLLAPLCVSLSYGLDWMVSQRSPRRDRDDPSRSQQP